MFRKILDFDGFLNKRDTCIHFFFFFHLLRYEFEALSDARSVNDLLDLINMFSSFSGVTLNFSLTRAGSLNEVKTAICRIKCIDMTKETVNILGIFYSLDKKIKPEKIST